METGRDKMTLEGGSEKIQSGSVYQFFKQRAITGPPYFPGPVKSLMQQKNAKTHTRWKSQIDFSG